MVEVKSKDIGVEVKDVRRREVGFGKTLIEKNADYIKSNMGDCE